MNFFKLLLFAPLMVLSCTFKKKEYVTVYLPSDFCGEIYIVPDKNSQAKGNEIHLNSTGLYLMNYDAAESFSEFEFRIYQNGIEISDLCTFYYASSSVEKGNRHLDYKQITVPCKNANHEIKNERDFNKLVNEGENIRQ